MFVLSVPEKEPLSGAERKLKSLVRGCVLSSLCDVLGETATSAVTYLIAPETAYDDPARFHQMLYSLMKSPALTLESLIVRALYGQLDMEFEPSKFDFIGFITQAKRLGLSKSGIRDGVEG